MKRLAPILCFIFIFSTAYNQDGYSIDNYKGVVYDLTEEDVEAGYGKYIYQNEVIGKLNWRSINVLDRDINTPFTQVDFTTLFGIVFHSKIHVDEAACFEIVISSDDGSKVWIDDQLLIDNGGIHKMKEQRSNIQLTEGTHKIKIWYFQAHVRRYGLVFDINKVAKKCSDLPGYIETEGSKKLSLENNILFNTNEYLLKEKSFQSLDSICTIIQSSKLSQINIIGHSDSLGLDEYNMTLSQKRAEAIQKYLMEKIKNPAIKYIAKGFGETKPIAANNTSTGRAQNRRVEIILIIEN